MGELLGLVVLFHPDEEIGARIRSYLPDVSRLLVIDNSEPSSKISQQLTGLDPRIEVIVNRSNKGIACALNQGVEYGRRHRFNWLLTMDQDSAFAPGALNVMKEFMKEESPAAILSPVLLLPGDVLRRARNQTTTLRMAMTSGNLLNLTICAECGPFEEKLFIDSVDHEYCLRVRRRGYTIKRVNEAVLHHNLGQPRKVFGQKRIISHPAHRRYYMTRNSLYVIGKYITFDPIFCTKEFWGLLKSFFVVLLFETDKLTKLKAMGRGIWHFVIARYGKMSP